MFEHKTDPLLPRPKFLRRVAKHGLIAIMIIAFSLGIGIVGYHCLVGLGWIDSTLNASMILGGMGPVDPIPNAAGKLFASAYALFSGIIFLVAVGVLGAPLIHRFLHKFHLDK